MQTPFQFFVSCLLCVSLILASGCGNRDRTPTGRGSTSATATATPSPFTPAEQAEVDKLIAEHGTRALLHVNMREQTALKYIQYLISQGANINAKGHFDRVPLHLAARSGNIEVVKFLVSNGADVNVKNSFGDTSLDDAASSDHPAVVEYLKSVGAQSGGRDAPSFTLPPGWNQNPR